MSLIGLDEGRLDQRVMIQRNMALDDGSGGQTDDWANIFPKPQWASVTPLPGKVQEIADSAQGITEYRVEMRYRTGVESGMRVVWKGLNLYILSATNPDGREISLYLVCQHGARQ